MKWSQIQPGMKKYIPGVMIYNITGLECNELTGAMLKALSASTSRSDSE
jgi:hypothetical protein